MGQFICYRWFRDGNISPDDIQPAKKLLERMGCLDLTEILGLNDISKEGKDGERLSEESGKETR